MTLSPTEKALLLALKQGRHFKAKPAAPAELLKVESQDANPAGRRLVKLGFAARVQDGSRPGALLLRITDAGIAEAEITTEAQRKPNFREKLANIPWGKAGWDVFKIAFGAVLGVIAAKYFGTP